MDSASSYLIDAYLEDIRLASAARTREARGFLLRRLHAALPYGLAFAETEQLQRWLTEVAAGLSVWTLIVYGQHIKAFYRWFDDRYLVGDPAAAIRLPAKPVLVPRPASKVQLRLALDRSCPWWRLVILLAAREGLRASEIAELDREDVTAEQVLVRRGKGGDPGMVPTHPQVWRLVQPMPDGPLLRPGQCCRHPDRPLTGQLLTRWARDHFRAIQLWPGLTLHRFRHHFATELLRAGVDIRVVQELMRHRSITSTQGYTLVVSAQRAAAINRLCDL